jgi:lysophospholipase L1-like esterase
MQWAPLRCGIYVAITAAVACACGARARTCGGAPPPAAAPPIRLVGRFDPPSPVAGASDPRAFRFAWSGSSFVVRFVGTGVAMRLRAAPLEPHVVVIDGKPVTLDEKTTAYAVRVDDRPPVTIEVSHEHERYDLAVGLDPHAPHEVQVTREAEAFAGVHELLGVDLAAGGQFLPVPARRFRLEVVGDSISCGYGVIGKDEHCPFTYATERASEAYGARLGRALDADVTTVCWSGRGVLRNYDGSTTGTMPELFERTLPAEPPSPWSFSAAPAPDAVVVNLGTNDFLGGAGRPLDLAAFEEAYVRFARRIRELYPNAFVFVTTSPMLKAEVHDVARTRLEHVVARRTSEGDTRIELIPFEPEATNAHWGCDSHPDAEMNGRMAARLEPAIRARLPR